MSSGCSQDLLGVCSLCSRVVLAFLMVCSQDVLRMFSACPRDALQMFLNVLGIFLAWPRKVLGICYSGSRDKLDMSSVFPLVLCGVFSGYSGDAPEICFRTLPE